MRRNIDFSIWTNSILNIVTYLVNPDLLSHLTTDVTQSLFAVKAVCLQTTVSKHSDNLTVFYLIKKDNSSKNVSRNYRRVGQERIWKMDPKKQQRNGSAQPRDLFCDRKQLISVHAC
jgi:hypothetical protein